MYSDIRNEVGRFVRYLKFIFNSMMLSMRLISFIFDFSFSLFAQKCVAIFTEKKKYHFCSIYIWWILSSSVVVVVVVVVQIKMLVTNYFSLFSWRFCSIRTRKKRISSRFRCSKKQCAHNNSNEYCHAFNVLYFIFFVFFFPHEILNATSLRMHIINHLFLHTYTHTHAVHAHTE